MMIRSVRATTVLLALLVLLAGAGCADDRPPATRDDVILACGTLNLESCRAFGRCLGWDADEVQACVNEENVRCTFDVSKETCWDNQRDALERCAADIADDSCPEVCEGDGFCFAPCFYRCP